MIVSSYVAWDGQIGGERDSGAPFTGPAPLGGLDVVGGLLASKALTEPVRTVPSTLAASPLSPPPGSVSAAELDSMCPLEVLGSD